MLYFLLLILIIFGWEFVLGAGLYLTIIIGKILFVLFLISIPFFIVHELNEHKDKVARGGYKTAEEMKIEGEIAAEKAVEEYKVWNSKVTKSERDSIRKSMNETYEGPKCPKCHREFKYVWSDPKIDYIEGVGQVCTHCYIEYYKKHSNKNLEY